MCVDPVVSQKGRNNFVNHFGNFIYGLVKKNEMKGEIDRNMRSVCSAAWEQFDENDKLRWQHANIVIECDLLHKARRIIQQEFDCIKSKPAIYSISGESMFHPGIANGEAKPKIEYSNLIPATSNSSGMSEKSRETGSSCADHLKYNEITSKESSSRKLCKRDSLDSSSNSTNKISAKDLLKFRVVIKSKNQRQHELRKKGTIHDANAASGVSKNASVFLPDCTMQNPNVDRNSFNVRPKFRVKEKQPLYGIPSKKRDSTQQQPFEENNSREKDERPPETTSSLTKRALDEWNSYVSFLDRQALLPAAKRRKGIHDGITDGFSRYLLLQRK